jgi:hypothetical protein
MKKGVIEVQFNWIFILIIGALILAFFVSIVSKQKDLSEKKTGAKLAYDLETITTGAEVSKGTAQTINMPGLGITFAAKDCLRQYTIGGGTRVYKERIIFAPTLIDGSRLIAWTLPWDIPYRITNFLMITSPNMRYVLVNDDGSQATASFIRSINKTVPNTVFKDIPSGIGSVKDEGNYKVRFVYFSTSPPGSGPSFPNNFQKLKDLAVSALWVQYDPNADRAALIFYKKSGSAFVETGETYSLGRPSLYAAIFTDDYLIYNCNMREAFKKMYFVTKVFENRTKSLSDLMGTTSVCNNYYAEALSPSAPSGLMITMRTTAKGLSSSLPGPTSDADIGSIYTAAFDPSAGLVRVNANLQLHSCPEIY